MQLDIDLVLDFDVKQGDAALLMIEAANQDGQQILGSKLDICNAELRRVDSSDPLDQRIWARVSDNRLLTRYAASVQISRATTALEQLAATPLDNLPGDVLPYLRPSRFCPSDKFPQVVSEHFSHLQGGAMIAAMRDWVSSALCYVPGSSDAATTAIDTYNSREGVCRDYAHLVCSFARAAGIPARYVSGYGPNVTPQDFHAVAEVWLEGGWHLVDATAMSTPDNFVIIGAGRDCGDVAFLETRNDAQFRELRVSVSRA